VTQTTRRRSLWQPRPGRARCGVHGDMLAVAARTARAKVPEPPPELPPLEPYEPPEQEPEPDETLAPPWEPARGAGFRRGARGRGQPEPTPRGRRCRYRLNGEWRRARAPRVRIRGDEPGAVTRRPRAPTPGPLAALASDVLGLGRTDALDIERSALDARCWGDRKPAGAGRTHSRKPADGVPVATAQNGRYALVRAVAVAGLDRVRETGGDRRIERTSRRTLGPASARCRGG
jgi:hypothetical protein